MKQYLEAGKVVATHGIHGELRVYPWGDSARDLCAAKTLYLDAEGKRPLRVVSARPHKNLALIQFETLHTVDEARKLIDRVLYVDRQDIPLEEGSHFVVDLLGINVVDADDPAIHYGTLAEVTSNGAYDIYHIDMPDGSVGMVPAVKEILIETNVDTRIMRIRPPKGLLNDAD